MAIQKTVQFANGLSCTNAYIKVYACGGTKQSQVMEVTISKNKEFSDAGNVIERKNIVFTPDVSTNSKNFIAQAYQNLKTLPDYSDAVDV